MLVGLYVNGKLKPVMKAGLCPEIYEMRNRGELKLEEWRGQVVEVQGYEIFKSGAVRSGYVIRKRTDKSTSESTLENK